jgi:sphingomyelin phosphodiesterase
VGADANCTKNICCRAFADEDGKPISIPAGPNGNSKCDSPGSLADSMLNFVNDINPKFVIFTGDVVEGTYLNSSQIVLSKYSSPSKGLLGLLIRRLFFCHSLYYPPLILFSEVEADLVDFNAQLLATVKAPIYPALGNDSSS